MKAKTIQRFIQCTFTASVGFITFVAMPANAAHEKIYAVDFNNNLIEFYSDAPATILGAHAINGLSPAEEIRGIDSWNGTIYGLGSSSHLYTLDPNTGFATQVGGMFAPILNGATFGIDNGPSGVQVVSGLGQSLLVNRSTAAVTVEPNLAYAAGDPFAGAAPAVDALAYNAATGKWYAEDTLRNTLASFDPNTGILSTIGVNGIDASRFNGLDISPDTRIMYMATPAASSDPQANLYTVSPLTGAVTLIGLIGNPGDDFLFRGLTVDDPAVNAQTVPDGGTTALLLGAALSTLGLIRRRLA